MDRQQMTRREWVSAQLTTWQNVLSAIWIFAILMYTFIHGFNPWVIIGAFVGFFIVTAWQMIYMMLAFSLIAGGLCAIFPFLAPVAFIIMIVLFIARIGFILKNWRAVIAGLMVYGLAFVLYFRMDWLNTLYRPIYRGLATIVNTFPHVFFTVVHASLLVRVLALTALAALIAFIFQLLLYWLYRNGYSSSGALNIMGSIPLVIIALVLPFLKAAAGGGVDGGMADGFAHDGAFAHDGVVSHEGLVKAPSGYHHVNGYTRIAPDGHTEYVHDYIRSNPDGILENNLSYHGNHPVVEGTYQALPGEAAHVPASTGHSLYVMLAGGMKSGWRVVANIGRHTLITLFLVYTAVFLVTGIVVYTVYR